MKEQPIIFKPEMVRAILEGRKTQTRRIIKNVMPDSEDAEEEEYFWAFGDGHSGIGWYQGLSEYSSEGSIFFKCPYGVPGDRLWVRETFSILQDKPTMNRVIYRVDHGFTGGGIKYDLAKWKPSIHMPRWASRINLEVTNVRVQRVMAISRKDAIAEGAVQINKHFLMDPEVLKIPVKYSNVTQLNDERYWGNDNAPGAFASYFEKINGSDAWDRNPWVWVVEFKEVKP